MNDFSSHDQSYECFLTEAPELLRTLEHELLTLKEDRSSNKIYSLMRAAHTLKGMVASIGLEAVEQIAHSLEGVFNALYNPAIVIDTDLEMLLFQGYECLYLLLTAEWTPGSIDKASISNQATVVFAQLQEKLGDFLGQSIYLPTSAELKVDIVQSIFETVVEEGLATLAAALEQSTAKKTLLILREKATVFLGLAQGLSLPGFASIAQIAIEAIDAHPNQAIIIARIALADFQQGKAQVLAGDRTRGGEPSMMLQQFVKLYMSDSINNQPEAASQPKAGSVSLSPSRTIRVDLERLNQLKYLAGNLLASQTQQGIVREHLQNTLHKFRDNFQQHQQTLNEIRETLNQIRDLSKVNQNPYIEVQISPLMQIALEESIQLEEALGQVTLVHQQMSQALEQQQQWVTHIRDDLTDAQMTPLSEVCNRLSSVLHRLVAVHNKPAELKFSGTEVLIEKAIAEKLYAPLLHLVRNAFDHGLESRADRQLQGKLVTGQIHIHVYQQEQWMVIEVQDDGRGLDFNQIRERAVQMQLLLPTEADSVPDLQLQALLFEPRFSTTTQVSEISGRGIGLNVVRSQIQALQGAIAVQSRPQEGTTFVLQIPTLSVPPRLPAIAPEIQDYLVELGHAPAEVLPSPSLEETWEYLPIPPMLESLDSYSAVSQSNPENSSFLTTRSIKTTELFSWMANSVIFVLPYNRIEEYLAPKISQVIQSRNQRFLHWQDQMIRVYPLSDLLNDSDFLSSPASCSSQATILLIVRQGQQFIALESNLKRLITEPNLLIQAHDDPGAPSYLCGYTRLENDGLLPVVDIELLLNWTVSGQKLIDQAPMQTWVARKMSSPAVASEADLVVDDSATLRKLLSVALEEVGYQVLQAQDGQEAIE
jgi:two-component system, chemotaxis family, sensor histidine kinase and response regulator PixL